ncbi:MAG: hypothetical protein EXQ49_03425 [Acidobacteria bacterium]|nr:hypothetical protein [Acidobacteriota bacterium]
MAELKTKETRASVKAFLDRVENPQVRADCYAIAALMESVTKGKPKMWLGRCTTSKSCLYIKRLSDIHVPTLKKLKAAARKA